MTMETSSSKLCEICGERPATVTVAIAQEKLVRRLCEKCYKTIQSPRGISAGWVNSGGETRFYWNRDEDDSEVKS